jgi:hypothetical protein
MTVAMEEKKVERREAIVLTSAQVLTWLAWRGSARAANQARPGDDFTDGGTVSAPGAPDHGYFHRCCMTTKTATALPPAHDWEVIIDGELRGDQSRRNPSQRWQGSPRRGGGYQIQSMEGVEDAEEHRLPQVAVAEIVGGKRNRRRRRQRLGFARAAQEGVR